MTTFKRNIKKNTPYKYAVTEHGYWDYTGNISADDDTVVDINLSTYPNVDSSYKVNTISIPSFKLNDCTLPNKKPYTTKKYALDKVGYDHVLFEDYYYNFKINGENIVDDKTGLMSNITNSNNIAKTFAPQSEKWSITIELQTPSSFNNKSSIYGTYDAPYTMPELYINTDGTLGLCLSSNGSSWDIADNVSSTSMLYPSTKYKIVLSYNSSEYTLKVTPISDYFANEEETYINITSSTPIFSNQDNYLNIGYSKEGNCFKGNIYLNNTYIVIDDICHKFTTSFLSSAPGLLENNIESASEKNLNIFVKRSDNSLLLDNKMQTKEYMWVGTKAFDKYSFTEASMGKLIANYETTGDLIPTDINLYVGPFSSTNFIKASNINLQWTNNFIAYQTFETGSDITTAQSIFSNALNGSIGIHNGKWKVNTTNPIYGHELHPNTLYDIKLVQDINNLYLYTREHTDNNANAWELQITTIPQYLPSDTFYIGNNGQNEPFLGKIHLKTVRIEAEETSWYACELQSNIIPI